MVLIRPSRISLRTFITAEMLNTESCRDKVLMFPQEPVPSYIGRTYDMALPPLAIASTLPEIHLAWAKCSYIDKLHTIQLNYLYTAASEAIFSSSRGGAAYGGV